MDYKDIVKSSFHNDESEMWNSVDRINVFLDRLKKWFVLFGQRSAI